MLTDDVVGDGETQSGALSRGLCGEEGVEDAIADRFGDPRPIIADAYLDAVIAGTRRYPHRPAALLGNRLGGVDRQVQYCLDQVIGAAFAEIVSEEAHEEFMDECDLTSEQIWPEIDSDKCNGCGMCANCIHGGISMEGEKPKTHLDLCMRCGVCASVCPVDGIQMARA